MTLSVQSINPKTEKRILSWGGGGAMLSALALYHYKGDGTLFKYISWILGGGGLVALCCGSGGETVNNSLGLNTLVATNVSRPVVDSIAFLSRLKNDTSSLNSSDMSICKIRGIYNKQFKENHILDNFLIQILKEGNIHPGIRLAAADRLIENNKACEVDKAIRENDFGQDANPGDNRLVYKEIMELFTPVPWFGY